MENLYLKLKQDLLDSRKAKDTDNVKFIAFLLAEADRELIAKKPENEQGAIMLNVLQKYEKSVLKSIDNLASDLLAVNAFKAELERLQKYLPKKLTKDEIRTLILENKDLQTFGEVMKFFSSTYKGLFDSKIIQEVYTDLVGN